MPQAQGNVASPVQLRCHRRAAGEFDLRDLVYRDLQLTGATIVPPDTMRRLVKLIERNLLKPLLAQTFPLGQLAQAQQAFVEKKHVGNIVVET